MHPLWRGYKDAAKAGTTNVAATPRWLHMAGPVQRQSYLMSH